jgi:fructose-bisphosphate aldolase class II
MPLFPFRRMLDLALENGFAVGYFQAWNGDSLEATVEAGEELDSPLVIGFGGTPVNQAWFDSWGLESAAVLGIAAVKRTGIPVSLILNETETLEQCFRGIELGFNVVMVDSSALPYRENLEVNRKLVTKARLRGVAVEGELGHLPTGETGGTPIGRPGESGGTPGGHRGAAGSEKSGYPGGSRDGSSLTDPEQAGEFVRETGVDALSVSVGNVHVLTRGKAEVDLDLIARIREKTGVPLVIHGGTGFPPGRVKEAIKRGVAKFNVGTVLKKLYYEGLKASLARTDASQDMQLLVGSREASDITSEAKRKVKEKVKELIRLYGSEGKARLFR